MRVSNKTDNTMPEDNVERAWLRDMIAANALHGAAAIMVSPNPPEDYAVQVAQRAYQIADACLAERQRQVEAVNEVETASQELQIEVLRSALADTLTAMGLANLHHVASNRHFAEAMARARLALDQTNPERQVAA